MITDCDIVEPAGNECICIPRVLFKVRIDTASSSKEQHELVITGLRDPHSFKKLVWAMKRMQQLQHHPYPNTREMTSNDAVGNSINNDISSLLREIRDELRQNNETLLAIQGPYRQAKQAIPSIPTEEARFV
jgi:hypothetical protein